MLPTPDGDLPRGGARDRLELDLHPGPHAWGGNKSAAFFKKHLDFPVKR